MCRRYNEVICSFWAELTQFRHYAQLLIKKTIKIGVYAVCACESGIFRCRPPDSVIAIKLQCRLWKPRSPGRGDPQFEKGSISVLWVMAWGHHGFWAVLSELKLLLGSPAGRQNIEAKDESQRTGQQAGNGQVIIGWRVQRVIG